MTGGSQQLRIFRRARRDGASVEDAAAAAGIAIGEARLHAAEDDENSPAPECFELLSTTPAEEEATLAGQRKAREPEQTSSEIPQPDLKSMKSIFLRDLKPAEEKAAKTRGDQSAAWKTIEKDCHCNKKAAKALFALNNQSEELREDFLRTFLPGLLELNLVPEGDLVDLAQDLSPGIVAGAKSMGTEGMPALN